MTVTRTRPPFPFPDTRLILPKIRPMRHNVRRLPTAAAPRGFAYMILVGLPALFLWMTLRLGTAEALSSASSPPSIFLLIRERCYTVYVGYPRNGARGFGRCRAIGGLMGRSRVGGGNNPPSPVCGGIGSPEFPWSRRHDRRRSRLCR